MDATIPFSSTVKSHFSDKPVLWHISSNPSLTESYHLHSHLTVHNHTTSLAHHYQSKSSSLNSIYLNDSFYHVNNSSPSLSFNTGGKYKPESIELDHSDSCSLHRANHALRTLVEPQPPSPSTSPPLPPSLPSTTSISVPQQIMLISTPPTPPPSSSSMMNSNEIDSSQQQQPFYTKSSSAYVLSPSTPYFPSHHHSTPPPSSPSSCALVQFVQLHRILPSTKTHNFASTTPVTTSDS
jgi:hypothetical protein